MLCLLSGEALSCGGPGSSPPTITDYSPGVPEACEGCPVSFSVTAHDLDGPEMWDQLTFKWYVDGIQKFTETVDNSATCGSYFSTPLTPGAHTVMVRVNDNPTKYIDDPVEAVHTFSPVTQVDSELCELSFLKPDAGIVGGAVPIRFQIREHCADTYTLTLKAKEVTELHSTDWVTIAESGPGVFRLVDSGYDPETDISTAVWEFGYWPTTTLHNGTYTLRLECRTCCGFLHSVEREIQVRNLAITGVDPPGHIPWDGENPPPPIVVSVDDNDTTDPMTFTLTLMSCALARPEDYPVRTITQSGVTGGTCTFQWDGNDDLGAVAPAGLYTYQVAVAQTDVNEDPPNQPLTCGDGTDYLSTHLFLGRAIDEDGHAMTSVEYGGYDDNGTPEEEDDNYIYIIRWYTLQDGWPVKDATEGTLKLYDPEMHLKATWSVAGLQCMVHTGQCDGLHPGPLGEPETHALKVPVSTSLMDVAGDYRFVLHAVDDHAADYRDHRFTKPSMDLNAVISRCAVAIYCCDDYDPGNPGFTNDDSVYGLRLYNEFLKNDIWNGDTRRWEFGYAGWPPLGHPESGGSGVMINKPSRSVIRTLGRICPTEAASVPANYATRNSIWAFYGHAAAQRLDFDGAGEVNVGRELPSAELYDVSNFSLSHIRLAYLSGCETAGLHGTPTSASITAGFKAAGCQCVVGFWGTMYRQPSYDEFDANFWRFVSRGIVRNGVRNGISVKHALKEALARISYGAKRRSKTVPTPIILGDTRLYPVR